MARFLCFLVLVTLAFGARLTAQSRADFSGIWTAVDSSLTIRQSGTTLTIGEGSQARSFNLDGTESRYASGRSQYTARATWVGSALVVAITTVSPIGIWENLEVYSLDYGPTLTVVTMGAQTTRPMMYTTTKTYARR